MVTRGEHRVGFININDMYNNDVGKGGVYAYEAYEVKNKSQNLRSDYMGKFS